MLCILHLIFISLNNTNFTAMCLELIQEKNNLIKEIKRLANLLDAYYGSELNFRNHCYLRIAYDCTMQSKWDLACKTPFIKYATNKNLQIAVALLNTYFIDKKRLLADNDKSLNFRKNSANRGATGDLRLF